MLRTYVLIRFVGLAGLASGRQWHARPPRIYPTTPLQEGIIVRSMIARYGGLVRVMVEKITQGDFELIQCLTAVY